MITSKKQKEAEKFEAFVYDWFQENKKLTLSHYHTKEEQFEKGENRQGIEIKNDQMFKKTGNLFISVMRQYDWSDYPSGIMKTYNGQPQSWLYVIGCEKMFYVFSTKQLIKYYEENKPKLFKGFITEKNGTEYGFLLSKGQAERLCVIKFDNQLKLF